MRLVELPPPRFHRLRIAELGSSRRTAELDEGRVGPVAQIEKLGVDRATLPPARRQGR